MLSDQELMAAVQGASEDYVVYGELGRTGDSLAALLARQRSDQKLVVLMVQGTTSPAGELELSVEVKPQLDARIPDGGTRCPACGATLRPWVRFCTRCGHDVTGRGAVTPEQRAELRAAVIAAVEDSYEYLGEMRRSEGGGDVFFAREKGTGRIAALRLNQSAATEGEFELGETNILRKAPSPFASSAGGGEKPMVSVTQLLRKLDPDPSTLRSAASVGGMNGTPPAAPSPLGERAPASSGGYPHWDPVPPPTGGGIPPRVLLAAGGVLVAIIVLLAILVLQ